MKRLLGGSVVLAASLGLVSCNGDPTSDFRNGPSQIIAEPSEVFLDQGDSEPVNVRVIDEAGDPLAATWEAEPGTGVSVERNPDFLPTTAGAPLESEVQFIVTAGSAPVATSITVTAGELSLEIPVNVMPTELAAATFSNATPAVNEPVTLTVEGFTFLPDAAVLIGGDSAVITSNIGESLTFVPIPGSTGVATIENISVNFLPGVPLTLPTTAELTAGPASAVAGTEDPATAPSLLTPAAGEASAFFDKPDFAATPDHWYQLTVTEAGTYAISVDWDIGSDIDLIVCEGQPAPDFSNCPLFSFTGHPELVEADLAPGTYLILVEDFTGIDPGIPDAVGATVEIVVQHAAATEGITRTSATTTDVRKLQRLLRK